MRSVSLLKTSESGIDFKQRTDKTPLTEPVPVARLASI